MRYMVVPERPRGTESMNPEELAALITRDSLVGVEKVALPGGNA
jgi:nitrile hydratase